MILIPDANSIISALIKRGKAFELFEWNDLRKEIRFVAPEYLSSEIRENISSLINRSKLSEDEILEALNKIESQIEFVPFSKFKQFIPRALEISPPNDFPYIALALYLKKEGSEARILSNDKQLLESLSKVGIDGLALHELLKEIKLV